ncbi:MAG: hypothetical protein AAF773_01570 [Cyanobacteria bacterium P01_D01_bin.115]
MPDELLEDLHDLHQAIEQVFWEIACDDPDAISQAQRDALALIETLAVLHCQIVNTVIRDRRNLNRKMGIREISVPLNYEGLWLVTKPRNL